jgi:hypothetical protein
MMCKKNRAYVFLTEHVSLDCSQGLADEARLCIQDCGESFSIDEFNEELQTAKVAVDAAGVAYSELLEELALTTEGVEVLNEVRKLYGPLVDSLRHEFGKIGEANIVEKLK